MPREYLTADLQLAAYLAAQGHEPVRIEGPADRRCFVFLDIADAEVSGYHRSTVAVAPLELFGAYRRLRRQLFS